LGLVIGALMIIYAGYQYAMSSFDGWDPSKGQAAIKNALYGILVIIFSYALIRIVTRAFLY
jgi:TRAP-type C4-dicarboxylate transport system permease small subunit